MNTASARKQRKGRAWGRGFTLLEVILAVVIAAGLLLVVLHFYRQAAELRSQLTREAGQLGAVRIVMDRVTAELRCLAGGVEGDFAFVGGEHAIEFVRVALPARTPWTGGELGRAALADTDLRRVSYHAGDGWFTIGIWRGDEPLVPARPPLPQAGAVEAPEEAAAPPPPLTEEVQFLRFRYWDGTDWQVSWAGIHPPAAVEITLGFEPLPEDTLPEEYPYEQFRRVVALPAGLNSRGNPDSNAAETLQLTRVTP